LPDVTGSIGVLGTKPSWELMNECDTLLIAGSNFPYSEFLPAEGDAHAVQIDIDPRMIGLRYPTEVNLVGDSAEKLRALLPRLKQKERGKWRESIETNIADWWKTLEQRALASANGVNPQPVFYELSPRLPDGCIVTCDSGSAANWYARDRRLVVAVLNNGDLNQVTWEQRVLTGDPKYEASQVLPAFDYAGYAELVGLQSIRVERDEDVAPAWERALAAQRPVLIDARTDPEVPPLPPHINAEQAIHFMKSMLKGDPERKGTLRATLKQLFSARH
jgi:pyruvate dehydrogenase (quinone)